MKTYILDHIDKGEYSMALLNLSLMDIFNNYIEIEERIENSILLTIMTFLESKKGLIISGENIVYEDNVFNILSEYSKSERKYSIVIINPLKKYSSKIYEIGIKGIGRVTKLEFVFPSIFCDKIEILIDIIKEQISFAYSSLEVALLNKIDTLTNKVFYNLHDILIAKATSINSIEKISGNFWFDVTNLKTKKCRNFLTRDMLTIIIERLKETYFGNIPPILLISDFITSDITESLTSEALRQNKSFISLPFSEEFKIKHTNVWTLENIIFNYNAKYCQTYLLHGVKDEYLQVAYPVSLESVFVEVLDDPTKNALRIQFEKNYKYMFKLREAIKQFKRRIMSDKQKVKALNFSENIMEDLIVKDRIKDLIIDAFKKIVI